MGLSFDTGSRASQESNTAHPGRAGHLWGIILAGGEGQRVRQLMRRVAGDDLPKQYCAVIGRRSMLQHTLDRVATLIPRHHILTVIVRDHLEQARRQIQERPSQLLLIQPANRETAPGILLPLLWIRARDPEATVAIFPSDHFVFEEAVFMAHVGQAVRFLDEHPGLLILLGIAPDRPETAYGWIQPGEELGRHAGYGLFGVRRFWEKPIPAVAEQLYVQGCLWNSLVLVGRLCIFLRCIEKELPELWADFSAIAATMGTAREASVLEEVYRRIPAVNISRQLLEKIPPRLGIVPVKGVHWCDWGEEGRIIETLARIGKVQELMTRMKGARGDPYREAA